MSTAQVTEAHIDLVRCVLDAEWRGSNVEKKFAQLIADSEAKACAELRAEVEQWELAFQEQYARAERAEVERLKRDYDYDHKCLHEVRERCESWKQRAERAEAEMERLKPYVSKAVLTREGTMLCSPLVAVKFNEQTARAERAGADLATAKAIIASIEEDGTEEHNAAVRLRQELATERARVADLVADLNDACITLASAAEDCDDYAMQNTGFKLTAVREVLLQHIPNAAMKEGA